MNPTFKVRDYGAGMDHRFVLDNFSCLGHSEKRDTNDQVGGFGWGSKSAFAYTDAFTITVWQQGEKRVYSAFRQADGMPAIAHIATEPSSAPNGTEISSR